VAGLVDIGGCEINQVDCAGNRPLACVAKDGHEGVVKVILRQDNVTPDKPDDNRQTPLH